MTMTKKDYDAIAKILREETTTWDIKDALADLFAADNPRFDRSRWWEAVSGCHICGLPFGH